MSIVALLSQNKLISLVGAKPISVNKFLSQRSSHKPFAIPLNSVSALDKATTFCFLLLQVTRFPPTNVKYLDVDFLSVIFPIQSAFVYP